jgi:predicted RNA-binding protein with PIN domain
MPLIVDTYNVLHQTGVLPAEHSGLDTAELAALLGRSRWRRQPVLLVCDGRAAGRDQTARVGKVRVLYAGPSKTADELMIAMIGCSNSPRQLLVVTSDREILKAAKVRRCQTLRSDEFLTQLGDDLTRVRSAAKGTDEKRMPRQSVESWKAFFKLSDEEAAGLKATKLPAEFVARAMRDSDVARDGSPKRGKARAGSSQDRRSRRTRDAKTEALRDTPRLDARHALPAKVIAEAERLVAELENGD